MSADPFDLDRFVVAQAANVDVAIAELRTGRKRTHWSWYVFPQLRGLGSSAMAVRYGITGLAEAEAYLKHPVLRARLIDCVAAMNAHAGIGAAEVLGDIDAMKFRSCLTLFVRAGAPDTFRVALTRFFSGVEDEATVRLLARQAVIPRA